MLVNTTETGHFWPGILSQVTSTNIYGQVWPCQFSAEHKDLELVLLPRGQFLVGWYDGERKVVAGHSISSMEYEPL